MAGRDLVAVAQTGFSLWHYFEFLTSSDCCPTSPLFHLIETIYFAKFPFSGSGKTAAFLLPILHTLLTDYVNRWPFRDTVFRPLQKMDWATFTFHVFLQASWRLPSTWMCDSHPNQGARYSGISTINQIFSNIFVSTFFNIQIFDEARKFSFGSPLRAAIAYGGEIWIGKTFFANLCFAQVSPQAPSCRKYRRAAICWWPHRGGWFATILRILKYQNGG